MKKIIFAILCLLLLCMCSCNDKPQGTSPQKKPVKKEAIKPGLCVSDTTYKLTEWQKTKLYIDGKVIIVYEYKYKGHWYESHSWGYNDHYSAPRHSVNCDCLWMD